MKFSLFLAALASAAQAVNIQVVSVGKSVTNQTGLKFWPSNIQADVGSMVQFQFWVGNHTVTQSNFDNPCIPINNVNSSAVGIYSGYMPVGASADMSMIPTYTVTIKDTKPIWIYCSQAKHCQAGMSMVINENTSANSSRSLTNYQSLAQSATGSNIVPNDSTSGGDGSSTPTTIASGSSTTPTSSPASTDSPVVAAGSRMTSPASALFALVAVFALL